MNLVGDERISTARLSHEAVLSWTVEHMLVLKDDGLSGNDGLLKLGIVVKLYGLLWA